MKSLFVLSGLLISALIIDLACTSTATPIVASTPPAQSQTPPAPAIPTTSANNTGTSNPVMGPTPGIQIAPGIALTLEDEEIESSMREQIHSLDEKVIAAIQQSKLDTFLDYYSCDILNSGETKSQTQNAFPRIVAYSRDKSFKPLRDYYYRSAGVPGTCVVLAKNDDDFQVNLKAYTNEMFISLMQTDGQFNELLFSFVYAKANDVWKLQLCHLGEIRVSQKSAIQWNKESMEYYEKGFLTPAFLRAQITQECLAPAPFLSYKSSAEITNFLEKINGKWKQRYPSPVPVSALQSKPVVFDITPQFVIGEIIPAVRYITTYREDDVQNIKNEANLMAPIVSDMFPGISQDTHYILFKAYYELPVDPSKNYSVWSTIVEIKK